MELHLEDESDSEGLSDNEGMPDNAECMELLDDEFDLGPNILT